MSSVSRQSLDSLEVRLPVRVRAPPRRAEDTLGFVLRYPECIHGVGDWEPVGDQSAGELRAGGQQVGRLGEVWAAGVVAALAERGAQGDFLCEAASIGSALIGQHRDPNTCIGQATYSIKSEHA